MAKRKNTDTARSIPTEHFIRRSAWIIVVCDVVLVLGLLVCLLVFVSRNKTEVYDQNVETITNIAAAESGLLKVALDNTSEEVKAAYNYCKGKSTMQILDYLSIIGDEGDEYQLLTYDEASSTELYHVYRGYSTRKAGDSYQTVEYNNTSLASSIHQHASLLEGEVAYSQSFTNATDAQRYFAVFCGITVDDDGDAHKCYLVKPQREDRILSQLQAYSQYSNLSLAVCYADGSYLACDESFRAGNFFDYLYKYNDLSMDERNEICKSVQEDSDGAGVLTYKDYKGRDCIFAYAVCAGTENWHVIVAVPVSEFVSGQLLTVFPLLIILFLAALLVFNIWRLLVIVKELRLSVERESVANSSKSSFLSRMSHEIRTPLNAVIGYNAIARTEMASLKEDVDSGQAAAKVTDCLDKSEIASKHLLSIINDVLDMSAIESGKIEIAHDSFDFKMLINSLTTIFYSQAQRKGVLLEVLFDTPTEDWLVGDQMRVNQVLTNLLGNAVKFTSEGESITLRIRQTIISDSESSIHFEVIDTGIGMAAEYLEHIWSPFEQADSSISRRYGGTGLGLSITKTLVDLMGGSISVESTLNEGTTFSVDIPFGRSEQPQSTETYDFGSINALVVDDDIGTCDYIGMLFDRCGVKCEFATSGQEAIKAVSETYSRGGKYSFFLVDWHMPKVDGFETIRQIREIVGDDMPCVVLTAYDYMMVADEAAAVGVSKFISKPLFQSSLFDLLADVSEPKPSTVSDKAKGKYDFEGVRVLLAEDNKMNMEVAVRILASTGIVVDSAWNGKEAVEMFEASPAGTYNLILMDVHMPEMDGHEASRTIRASSHPEAQSIPIIAMTADVFAKDVSDARASGMNGHIAKPIDVSAMFETISKFV